MTGPWSDDPHDVPSDKEADDMNRESDDLARDLGFNVPEDDDR